MTSFRRFLADTRGTATIEFVLLLPLVLLIFFASFESSMFMIRNVMLERSVFDVSRDLRLGTVGNITHRQLKERLCENGILVGSEENCRASMRIWMQPVNTATFDMPTAPSACVDRTEPIDVNFAPPSGEFVLGNDNELMLLQICLKADPFFPTTAVGAGLTRGFPDGSYALRTTAIFVNEPG